MRDRRLVLGCTMQSSTREHQQGESPKRFLDSPPQALLPKPLKIPRTDTDHPSDKEKDEPESQQVMSQNPRLQRYLIAIEYIGTRFSGSQKQPNCRTVVGVLEEAFHKFIGQPVSIFCSSRTDAGVHALSNVCHVDVERISKRKPGEVLPPHEPEVVQRAVNHFLQKNEGDIAVIDVRCIPSDFHARYKARERIYYYRLLSGPKTLSTFEKDRAWHISEELDVFAMQKACKILVGQHDFSSFRAAGCQANSPIRTLDELSVTEVFPTPYFPPSIEREHFDSLKQNASLSASESSIEMPSKSSIVDHCEVVDSNNRSHLEFGQQRRNRCYVITARARSFLYHQVRLLVGVLKAVGVGDLTTDDVQRILDAKNVTLASPMAPSCGLYLGQVKYVLP